MARTHFALDTFARLWEQWGKWNKSRTGYLFEDYACYDEVKYWAQNLALNVSLTDRGLEVESCPELDLKISGSS